MYRMTKRYVRMGSWTFQSRAIFLGVVETYARFEARSKQNDFAGYPLTCEVKIRFSRAFHTSRTIRHPVPTTQISLVDWRFDLSQSWGINSDVNKFQLFEETKMRLAGSITGGYQCTKALTICLLKYLTFVVSNSQVIFRNNRRLIIHPPTMGTNFILVNVQIFSNGS